jgi:hypothetical protein
LKRLWLAISDRRARQYDELEELMAPQAGYKRYQEEFAKRSLPAVPYFGKIVYFLWFNFWLGLFLRDFTFLEDGNPSDLPNGSINFEKMQRFGERVEFIQKYQSCPYQLSSDQRLQESLRTVSFINDDDKLYKLSLKAQPAMFKSVRESTEEGMTSGIDTSDVEVDEDSRVYNAISASDVETDSEDFRENSKKKNFFFFFFLTLDRFL